MFKMKKTISIILTVHNKAFLIKEVVEGILGNASEDTKEFIVIFDGCSDESERIFDQTVQGYEGGITIYKQHTPDVWETKANNVGLKMATCDFSCIVQDDMIIQENRFDQRLRRPVDLFSDCFAVSGRAAHNNILKREKLVITDLIGRENLTGEGRVMRKIKQMMAIHNDARDVFGIRDVVNRGPLLLDNEKTSKLGHFDEAFAPLDMDDHDLCYRAYQEFGWRCGSYTIRYQSDLEWSGKMASPASRKVFNEAYQKNQKILIDRHYALITGRKHNENRRVVQD